MYRKCPVCKEHYEFRLSFLPEALCDFCADYFWTEPEVNKKYLKAISKGYIKPIKDLWFLSN